MNIEIKITADSVEEMQAAFAKLARPATTVTVITDQAIAQGGELTLPAGTDLKVTAAEPEKPKRTRKAAAKAPETTQEAAGEPEAPRAATTPTEPEKPAETPQSAPEPLGEPTPTIDQIAAAGARLLDDDADKMTALLDLLGKYGVQAITQLKPEQLAGFAAGLRALGAEV